MRRVNLRKAEKRRYCGYSYEEITNMTDTLSNLEDDIAITEQEEKAMDIAIQALWEIRNAMLTNGKVVFDD